MFWRILIVVLLVCNAINFLLFSDDLKRLKKEENEKDDTDQ